jgi:hypothetical protein
MNYRTLAASVLALGLLAPVGAMAETNYNCSQDTNNRGEYADCNLSIEKSSQVGAAAAVVGEVKSGPVGDFIDETPAESNQRSSN